MASFSRDIVVMAPRDRVWTVVADIDNEPDYWHGTREVRNISREGSVTNRVVVQNFLGTKVDQRVTIRPMESVETEYLRGTTVGKKLVSIKDGGADGQTVRVDWDVRFTGVLRLASPYIKKHMVKGTENALARIKDVAEGKLTAAELRGTGHGRP